LGTPEISYAYALAQRFTKSAIALVETARRTIPLDGETRPSSLLPTVVEDHGRLHCFYGSHTTDVDMDLIVPYVVNASFALELYLKVLLYLESGKWRRCHQLHGLFNELSTDSRRAIEQCYSQQIKREPAYESIRATIQRDTSLKEFDWDLGHVLASISTAFERYRYAFEGDVCSFVGFWELKTALVGRIDSLWDSRAS